eukprot:TRINITY_DN297_c0_g1_i1.p1 TRINITY_DN297_c0_g1~~TRINITY_DN297_c0_g1_i1.p1  ORF type:complete len:799 (+),score=142.09 TRINITY_DN297_c0_g1_i1:837-3233(+)
MGDSDTTLGLESPIQTELGNQQALRGHGSSEGRVENGDENTDVLEMGGQEVRRLRSWRSADLANYLEASENGTDEVALPPFLGRSHLRQQYPRASSMPSTPVASCQGSPVDLMKPLRLSSGATVVRRAASGVVSGDQGREEREDREVITGEASSGTGPSGNVTGTRGGTSPAISGKPPVVSPIPWWPAGGRSTSAALLQGGQQGPGPGAGVEKGEAEFNENKNSMKGRVEKGIVRLETCCLPAIREDLWDESEGPLKKEEGEPAGAEAVPPEIRQSVVLGEEGDDEEGEEKEEAEEGEEEIPIAAPVLLHRSPKDGLPIALVVGKLSPRKEPGSFSPIASVNRGAEKRRHDFQVPSPPPPPSHPDLLEYWEWHSQSVPRISSSPTPFPAGARSGHSSLELPRPGTSSGSYAFHRLHSLPTHYSAAQSQRRPAGIERGSGTKASREVSRHQLSPKSQLILARVEGQMVAASSNAVALALPTVGGQNGDGASDFTFSRSSRSFAPPAALADLGVSGLPSGAAPPAFPPRSHSAASLAYKRSTPSGKGSGRGTAPLSPRLSLHGSSFRSGGPPQPLQTIRSLSSPSSLSRPYSVLPRAITNPLSPGSCNSPSQRNPIKLVEVSNPLLPTRSLPPPPSPLYRQSSIPVAKAVVPGWLEEDPGWPGKRRPSRLQLPPCSRLPLPAAFEPSQPFPSRWSPGEDRSPPLRANGVFLPAYSPASSPSSSSALPSPQMLSPGSFHVSSLVVEDRGEEDQPLSADQEKLGTANGDLDVYPGALQPVSPKVLTSPRRVSFAPIVEVLTF